jgi:hypothetical protein
MVHQRGLYEKGYFVSIASGLFLHSYPSRVPSPRKQGENIWSQSTKLHADEERLIYVQWGVAWIPKGIVYDTAITTPVPCSLQHDNLYLGLGRTEPC